MRRIIFFIYFFFTFIEIQFGQPDIGVQLLYNSKSKPAQGITCSIIDPKGNILFQDKSDQEGICYISIKDIKDSWYEAKFQCSFKAEKLGSDYWRNVKISRNIIIEYPSKITDSDILAEEENTKKLTKKVEKSNQKLDTLTSQLNTLMENLRYEKKERTNLEQEISNVKSALDSLEKELKIQRSLVEDLKFSYDKMGSPYVGSSMFNWNLLDSRSNRGKNRMASLDGFNGVEISLELRDSFHLKKEYIAKVYYYVFPFQEKFYLSDHQQKEEHYFRFWEKNVYTFGIIRDKKLLSHIESNQILALGIEMYYSGKYTHIKLADCYYKVCENELSESPYFLYLNNE